MRGAELASFALTVGGSLVSGPPAMQGAAAALGSMTLLEIMRDRARVRSARLDQAKDAFYFPYILKRDQARTDRYCHTG